MAKPTSAFFRAGPSLVPSPVTATTCLCSTTLLSMMPAHNKKCFSLKQGGNDTRANVSVCDRGHTHLWPVCVCRLARSERAREVWARFCQCVLVRSVGKRIKQKPWTIFRTFKGNKQAMEDVWGHLWENIWLCETSQKKWKKQKLFSFRTSFLRFQFQ